MSKVSKDTIYTVHTKLVDIILDNSDLITVLERMGISLGFGEATVGTICKQNELDDEFFLMLCRIYHNPKFVPDSNILTHTALPQILRYLKASHNYYTQTLFPLLAMRFEKTVMLLNPEHQQILKHFYQEYQEEAIRHFDYEENHVFPYVQHLIECGGTCGNSFHIQQFSENHTDIDSKLHDLKCIFIKYIPSTPGSWDLLHTIFHLEDDLQRHTIIEDNVLTPLVFRLEKTDSTKE